jgi:archaemetzincin
MVRILLSLALLCTTVPADAWAGAAGPERPRAAAAPAAPVVAIQPLGEVDPQAARAAARAIEATFAVRVVVLAPRPLPPAAYYRPRGRYRGEKILADLEARTPGRYAKVIGLMGRDLSVTTPRTYDWGVIGVAGLSRRAGVVSLYRLGRRRATPDQVTRRLGRVTVHELGHTFGLSHCRTAGCLMNDARGTVASVDRSSGRFCDRCRGRLGTLLRD